MDTALLAPPRTENKEPRTIIPLWLALPAGGAVLLIVALVAATLGLVSAGDLDRPPARTRDTAAAAERDARFRAARDEFESGRRTEAFAIFASLADQGHCDSARWALQLVQAGPEAYLTSFQAGPKQISRWRALPGCWPKAVAR